MVTPASAALTRPLLPALLALGLTLLAGCAALPLTYTDGAGKTYEGAIDPAKNSITAAIGGRQYRGDYQLNQWNRARTTLTAPGAEPLYCEFLVEVRKVRGRCTDLAGADYAIASR